MRQCERLKQKAILCNNFLLANQPTNHGNSHARQFQLRSCGKGGYRMISLWLKWPRMVEDLGGSLPAKFVGVWR